MTSTQRERRINRSDDAQLALSFQLAAAAKRARFSSIALADDLGTVIAAAGNKEICEHMAALSPILAAKMTDPWQGSIDTDCGAVRAAIAQVQVGPSRLYLSAAGGRHASVHKVLSSSSCGVSRILG
jgi:hypothetical protein